MFPSLDWNVLKHIFVYLWPWAFSCVSTVKLITLTLSASPHLLLMNLSVDNGRLQKHQRSRKRLAKRPSELLMRVKTCFQTLVIWSSSPANYYWLCGLVTSSGAKLPALLWVRCLPTCDSYQECGCLCMSVWSVCMCEEERVREQLGEPKCEWQLGAQRAPSITSACAARCARVAAAEEAWSEVPSCPSQRSQTRLLCGPPAGPIIWHMSAHTPNTHIS